MEGSLQLRFSAHQNRLHFLGGFKFEVFAQITVGTGDPDLLAVLGDFLVHEFFEFGLAFLQTTPGNDERFALLLGLPAADQTLEIRV